MAHTKSFKTLYEDYWKDHIWYQHLKESFTDSFIYLPSKDPEELIKLTDNCFGNRESGDKQSFNWYSPLFIYHDSMVVEQAVSGGHGHTRPHQKLLDKMRRGYSSDYNCENFGFYCYLDDLHPNVNLYYQTNNGKSLRNAFMIVFEVNNTFSGAVCIYLEGVPRLKVKPRYYSWGLSPDILKGKTIVKNNMYQRMVKYTKAQINRLEYKLCQRYLKFTNEQKTKKLKEELKMVGWFEETPKQLINSKFDFISLI